MAFPTIVVPVQALESQPQLLLVILQILGELVEVQTPILVLVSGGHDFLQELKRSKSDGNVDSSCVGGGHSYTRSHCRRHSIMQNDQALQVSAGLSLRFCYHRGGVCRVTCAAPRRNIPIALRPARNSATSTFPSLLASRLSNKSWYDLWLSASQHRAPGSKNVRSARYMLAAESG